MKQIQTVMVMALLVCGTAQSAQKVQSKPTISPTTVIGVLGLGAAIYGIYSAKKALDLFMAQQTLEFLLHEENLYHVQKHIDEHPALLTCTFGRGEHHRYKGGGSLLHVAVAFNRKDVVAELLASDRVNPAIRDRDGKTAEERALEISPEMVELFELIKKAKEEEPGLLNA